MFLLGFVESGVGKKFRDEASRARHFDPRIGFITDESTEADVLGYVLFVARYCRGWVAACR